MEKAEEAAAELLPIRQLKHQLQKRSGKLLPLVIVVAILPALVVLTASVKSLNILSKAQTGEELRLFFEPATVSTKINQPVKMTLMAGYDAGGKIWPGFSAALATDPSIAVFPQRVVYKTPFRGRLFVETIEAVPTQIGTYTLEIPVYLVETNQPDAQIRTVPATIIVKPEN